MTFLKTRKVIKLNTPIYFSVVRFYKSLFTEASFIFRKFQCNSESNLYKTFHYVYKKRYKASLGN